MTNIVIHPSTKNSLESYIGQSSQALGLIGHKWSGSSKVAKDLAEKLLNLPEGTLASYPYFLELSSDDQTIGIDLVRSLNEFLILKVPLKTTPNRVVVIERAEIMTIEAQNALLKNLEEPPYGTVIILSIEDSNKLLPTILSRLHLIRVQKPSKDDLFEFYKNQGYDLKDIDQAYLIADGLPELMEQLLSDPNNSFSLVKEQAKKLLRSTTFERLAMVNELAKSKTELFDLFFIIKQMSKIGLASDNIGSAKRWQRILEATLSSEDQLSHNVQTKLVLTNYILAIA